MAEPMEFTTPRLRLRQWKPSDREPFAALNADPKVMEFFPATLSRDESDAMAQRCESLIAQRGWGFWAAETKHNGEFIGFVGLNVPAADLPFSPCVEIGWRLGIAYWGRGLATEAAKGALRVGFEVLNLPEIVSFAPARNRRSRAVMSRLGMVEEGAGFEHPALPIGDHLREHVLCRLPRDRWEIGAA
jgi:RimJ/RimL family protein N-acetyltransferase